MALNTHYRNQTQIFTSWLHYPLRDHIWAYELYHRPPYFKLTLDKFSSPGLALSRGFAPFGWRVIPCDPIDIWIPVAVRWVSLTALPAIGRRLPGNQNVNDLSTAMGGYRHRVGRWLGNIDADWIGQNVDEHFSSNASGTMADCDWSTWLTTWLCQPIKIRLCTACIWRNMLTSQRSESRFLGHSCTGKSATGRCS